MSRESIVDSTMINVLNYSKSLISIPTHINPEGYVFEPSIEENQPTLIPISFSEIRVTNSQSQIFREGYLRFDKEIEADVYEALHIRDWENILSDDEIKDIIINPNKEKLEKLVKITSISLFDRIKSAMTLLVNTGVYDISQRVIDLVNNRYREIYHGIRKSEIEITKTQQEVNEEFKNNIIAEEIAKVKVELEKKIRAEIEAEIKSNLKNNEIITNQNEVINENKIEFIKSKVESKIENKPKSPGRPKGK